MGTGSGSRSSAVSKFLCINALRLVWIVALVWGELGAFYWSLRNCRWPGSAQKTSSISHVLLLSDTQVQHPALQTGHLSLTSGIRRFFNDLTLKKSWHVTTRLKPDVIVFLGDMLANGRGAKDEARYMKAVEKFKSMFSASVPVFYAPGNNDIWLGEITPYAKAVRRYYANAFGPPSRTFDVQNHTFVVLDAPGLVDEDYLRAGKGVPFAKWKPLSDGAISFVEDIASNQEASKVKKPVVLLSHIPLSRPEMANCGPLRERGTLRRNVGHGYQSMLGRQTTTFLLKTLKPLAVFSGDNRDYCEHSHTIAEDEHSIREVTLKSFSPSAHIRRPGFQLLSVSALPSSVSPPSSTSSPSTLADAPCFLPDQAQIYTRLYAPTVVLTFLVLLLLNVRRRRRARGTSRSAGMGANSLWKLGGAKRPTLPHLKRVGSSASVASSRSVSGRSTPLRQNSAPLSPLPLRMPRQLSGLDMSVPESPFAYARSEKGFDEKDDRQGDDADEDEDPMQPAQYATDARIRRVMSGSNMTRYDDHDHEELDSEWSDVGGRGAGDVEASPQQEDYDFASVSASSMLLSPPSTGSRSAVFSSSSPTGSRAGWGMVGAKAMAKRHKPMFSYSFVFAGRMRRITIRRPTMEALTDLIELLKGSDNRRSAKGGVFWATFVDMVSVAWPAVSVWWGIIWCIS